MARIMRLFAVKQIRIALQLMGVVSILIMVWAFVQPDQRQNLVDKLGNLPQSIQPVVISSQYEFAGERIPMESFDLRERMDRELIVNAYRHSSTLQYIKLATRYFPVIEPILKKNQIPDDFKYLAIAESGLRNVNSSAGAKGIWQFMELIAEDLGLEIYDEVDERYHLEKSTQAACEYLNQLHGRFGNWINAAAAYNAGPTNLSRYLREQSQDHYFDLNITDETMRYVFRIVAIKTILENPENFGFYIPEKDKYPPLDNYYTVKIDTSIANLGVFAQQNGTTYRMLKVYNPWLRSNELTVKENTYYIKIPKT